MKSERLCKCGCGGSMEEFHGRRQFLPECAYEGKRRRRRENYEKNRTSPKEYRGPRRTAPPPGVLQAPKSKTITADDVEAALKWGWCPRHPDRKAVALGLCAECGVARAG